MHHELVTAHWDAAKKLGIHVKRGLTVSSSGFFAPQGRDVRRIPPTLADIDQLFSDLEVGIDGQ